MKINRISYRELKNTGDYNNQSLEMEALLEDDDDLDECCKRLVSETKLQLRKAIELVPSKIDDEIPW